MCRTSICRNSFKNRRKAGDITMKVQVLLENTTLSEDLQAEHGLSLYIETSKHKILFDMGQSNAFAENAEKLGVDLAQVDIAVLSHGHYDHGGGLGYFLQINQKAIVYLQRNAFMPHYNGVGKYIGLNKELERSKRLIFTEDTLKIDEELTLFSCNQKIRPFSFGSFGLGMVDKGKFLPDDFRHEQYLLIQEEEKKVLVSGCSHKGILNIMSWFLPDVLIGGFHFVKLEPLGDGREKLAQAGKMLKKYSAKYFTGHCTGVEQYRFLKELLGEQLEYLATGAEFVV